jgi:hypothetical protein
LIEVLRKSIQSQEPFKMENQMLIRIEGRIPSFIRDKYPRKVGDMLDDVTVNWNESNQEASLNAILARSAIKQDSPEFGMNILP